MAKHIIYLKEGSDAAVLTMDHLREFHKELLNQPPQGQDAVSTMRLTSQVLAQKAVQFEVWKLRMASLEQRMQNIINLVRVDKIAQSSDLILTLFQSFNVVTQQDSHIMKNDSKSMRAIAIVTMAFLPLATIAVREHSFLGLQTQLTKKQAIFGSQFFNFDPQSRKILVATDFWIFWALIGALSLAVSLLYYYLYYFRSPKEEARPKVSKLKQFMSS